MKKVMKIIAVTILAMAALGVSAYLYGSRSVAQDGNTEAMEERIIELGNLYRAQAGLGPLTETELI